MALRTALLAPQSTNFLEKELQRRFNITLLRSGINGAEFVSVIFALLPNAIKYIH